MHIYVCHKAHKISLIERGYKKSTSFKRRVDRNYRMGLDAISLLTLLYVKRLSRVVHKGRLKREVKKLSSPLNRTKVFNKNSLKIITNL